MLACEQFNVIGFQLTKTLTVREDVAQTTNCFQTCLMNEFH